MANNKKSKSSGKSSSGISFNKVSFYLICVTAILYLVALILNFLHLDTRIVSVIQSVATAVMLVLIAISAWRYVSKKPTVWKVLYVVCLLVVIVGIILPLIF